MHAAEIAASFSGERWSVDRRARERLGVNWIEGRDRPGLAPLSGQRHDVIHTGYNSGFQAIGLAALFGATQILLLGFDFAHDGLKVHWHGHHQAGLSNSGHFPLWIAAMNRLALDLQKSHIEVINCSRRSALKCFPRRSIEASL